MNVSERSIRRWENGEANPLPIARVILADVLADYARDEFEKLKETLD
jgi:DNA-binding transcriptional regulator YiaG